MLSTLAVSSYRSLREFVIPLDRLNLVTGPNGSRKSNLYRALRLLAETAQGRVIPSLAREGGLSSTLWAGPESVSRSVLAGDEFGYAIDLGLPSQGPTAGPGARSAFNHDPEIKRECVWNGETLRPSSILVDRRGPLVRSRCEGDDWLIVTHSLSTFDSMMTHCADPRQTPELLMLREDIRRWRFYDQLRTDQAAPARLPQIGTHTPILANDGADFAAAIQTIVEIGDAEALSEAVADAFPGARVAVTANDGWFEVQMQQQGLLRPLRAAELSDGTLRYLLWVAALLTPRPPGLPVLNEPETSLHPDLLPALARLIVRASERSQVIVVSHAEGLIDALQTLPECQAIMLDKRVGETRVGESATGRPQPPWRWPAR
jgi:predicted ATPase